MNTDYKNIFTKSSCLTHNEMKEYLSGNLSEKGKHKVEFHIIDCEMCNDELEGFSFLQDNNKLHSIISSLNNSVDQKTKNEHLSIAPKKNNFRRIFAIAASIALLITVGWVIKNTGFSSSNDLAEVAKTAKETKINREEEIVTHNTDKDKKTAEDTDSGTIIDISENTKNDEVSKTEEEKSELNNLTANTETDSDINENEDVEIIVGVSSEEDVDEVIAEIKPEITGETKIELADAEKENDNSKSRSSDIENPVLSDFNTRGEVKNSKKSEINISSLKESGILAFKVKSYKEASEDFEKYLINNRKDYEIIYKSGVAYYHQKKYSVALKRFNKVINGDFNKYFEDAEWYKALTLIKLNKKEEALKLLKQIAYGHSDYKKQASDKIKEIEN